MLESLSSLKYTERNAIVNDAVSPHLRKFIPLIVREMLEKQRRQRSWPMLESSFTERVVMTVDGRQILFAHCCCVVLALMAVVCKQL